MGTKIRQDGIRPQIALLLAAVLALLGCAVKPTLPAAATQRATAVATVTQQATAAPTPTQTVTPEPSPTAKAVDVEPVGRLTTRRAGSIPVLDGYIDEVWATADALRLPLTWGMHGTEHALDLELRALYTDESVYLLAQWSGEPPSGEENAVLSKLTVHWRIPEPAAQVMDCTTVCHTAFADEDGHFVYASADTIPLGGSADLPVAGRWEAGTWTLEWSRPLISANPYDLQFDDLDQLYTFFVKVFEGLEDRPDPVSQRHLLVFQP